MRAGKERARADPFFLAGGYRLLGPVALLVQAIMGVLVIGSLLIKRGREKPRRRWRVWIGFVVLFFLQLFSLSNASPVVI